MKQFCLQVSEEMEGERIDKCLSTQIDFLSRSAIQKLIKEDSVFVNDRAVKGSYRLRTDDDIRFFVPETQEPEIRAENIPLDVLYEDQDVLVVNKPKSMVVHPAAGHYSGTLVNALLFYCGENLSDVNGILRPGIVHRIDKDTTGSLVVCKNNFSHENLALQFRNHTVRRKYRAICHGVIEQDSGTVDKPIGRNPKDRTRMTVTDTGKEAVTHYRVLKRFDRYTYIECELETGRTHQIRVHMADIHHPILGDEVYCDRPCPFHLTGQTLHAGLLGFVHPRTGKYIETQAPLPEYFEHLLHIL